MQKLLLFCSFMFFFIPHIINLIGSTVVQLLVVGLYRAPLMSDKSVLPFVYTCPRPDLVIRSKDRMYVYGNPVQLRHALDNCFNLPFSFMSSNTTSLNFVEERAQSKSQERSGDQGPKLRAMFVKGGTTAADAAASTAASISGSAVSEELDKRVQTPLQTRNSGISGLSGFTGLTPIQLNLGGSPFSSNKVHPAPLNTSPLMLSTPVRSVGSLSQSSPLQSHRSSGRKSKTGSDKLMTAEPLTEEGPESE